MREVSSIFGNYIDEGQFADLIKNGEYAVITMAGGQRNKTWTQWTKRNF